MGLELYQQYDIVREIFDMTEEISKLPISKLCFQGPMEELTMTVNLQPAITAVNLAVLRSFRKKASIRASVRGIVWENTARYAPQASFQNKTAFGWCASAGK